MIASVAWRLRMEKDDNIELILKGAGSDISIDFYEPIVIPTENYEAKLGLKSFSTYNNIPNIEKGRNNCIKIKVPGHDYKVMRLDTGAYELSMLKNQFVEWIKLTFPTLEKVEEDFKLIGNEATSKAEFVFKGDYGVDFDVQASIYNILGFEKNKKFQGTGRYVAKRIINIVNVTQLVFNCSLTESNYVNGRESPFLYNCGINVPVGFRLFRELTDISYKSLTTSQISHIRVWIVDQDGAPVNLRKDDLTVTLSLRLKQKVAPVSIVG